MISDYEAFKQWEKTVARDYSRTVGTSAVRQMPMSGEFWGAAQGVIDEVAMESGKMLACPFCGGVARMECDEGPLGARFSVGCVSDDGGECMGYQSLTTFARRSDAVKAWNTRAEVDFWRDLLLLAVDAFDNIAAGQRIDPRTMARMRAEEIRRRIADHGTLT